MVACHTGPAVRLPRLKAKKIPSLLADPTSWCKVPLIVAVNSVGVDPKSASPADCSEVGTVQCPTSVRSDALSSIMAGAIVPSQLGLPVTMYTWEAAVSMVGDPHTPPPGQLDDTVLKTCWMAPVVAFSWMSWP